MRRTSTSSSKRRTPGHARPTADEFEISDIEKSGAGHRSGAGAHLERFGERKHAEYKALIRQALKDIAADPFGFPAKERRELHPDARTFHLGRKGQRATHFFLYRVSKGQFIDIARLLHDAMDLERRLPPGFESKQP